MTISQLSKMLIFLPKCVAFRWSAVIVSLIPRGLLVLVGNSLKDVSGRGNVLPLLFVIRSNSMNSSTDMVTLMLVQSSVILTYSVGV